MIAPANRHPIPIPAVAPDVTPLVLGERVGVAAFDVEADVILDAVFVGWLDTAAEGSAVGPGVTLGFEELDELVVG